MSRNVEQDLIDAVMPNRDQVSRDEMVKLGAKATWAVIKPIALLVIAWQAWNVMPINQGRQLSLLDTLGGVCFLSCVVKLVKD